MQCLSKKCLPLKEDGLAKVLIINQYYFEKQNFEHTLPRHATHPTPVSFAFFMAISLQKLATTFSKKIQERASKSKLPF